MWIKNTDDGKWYNESVDVLPKSIFNSLEQAIGSVTLYSKALSGSTYVAINSLTDIFDVIDGRKLYNWYIGINGSQYSVGLTPSNSKSIDNNTSDEYYNKFVYEYGLTLKNKFTPVKLINDSDKNYLEVDVATTGEINNLGSYSPGLVIDAVILKPGHRVLVKDQISYVTLSSHIDPNTYFKGDYTVEQNEVTSIKYSYYNEQNGIYSYTDNTLTRTNDLGTYDEAYRYSVIVKLGDTNKLNQYHLKRLRNGYFPLYKEHDPVKFEVKKNWILKNRVDYHNIYEISYYDIREFPTQSYVETYTQSSYIYSIPSRVISIGDFGMIVVYQGGNSNIIENKYKETLRSISENTKYYWICGYNGTLLRVSKLDFTITQVIDEFNDLMSIDFVDDLRGLVVGKYNTIYFTQDGGETWGSISSPDFDQYSYNKVVYKSFDKAFIGGNSGVFIEMTFAANTWTMYKRSIIKYLDVNEPTEEYLLVDDIRDMSLFTFTSSNPWSLSYSVATSSTISSTKESLFMVTNSGNILLYDVNNFLQDYEFLYLSLSQSTTTDIQSISVVSGSSSIYIASDKVYSFDINNFKNFNSTTNNLSSTYSATLEYDYFANKLFDYNGKNLYLCGNYSTLNYSGYTSSLNDLDSEFNYRYNSKLLFLDYEIGSKLNFIDITDQHYRLPNSLTFSSFDISGLLSVTNLSGENNWLNYYKDKEKTFQYYTSIDRTSEVLFSTTFSYFSASYFPFTSKDINITYDAIVGLAPSINEPRQSRYMAWTDPIVGSTYSESIFIYKYMLILRKDMNYICDIGDVFYLSCDIVSTTFILNRKISFGYHNMYLYFYTDLNQSIINDLKSFKGTISITNLNKFSTSQAPTSLLTGNTASNDIIDLTSILNYYDYDPHNYFAYAPTGSSNLLLSFNLHPVSYGYKLTYDTSNDVYTLSAKYNNKTAYYNMQSYIQTNTFGGTMSYDKPFLKFGYKPTYNLLDYLSGVDSTKFTPSKVFTSMPQYQGLPGNDVNNFAPNNIYIDTNYDTNKLIFGSDLEFEWNSIWLNTFVDVTLYSGMTSFLTQDLLVMKKYFDLPSNGYVIEFHKKLNYNYNSPISSIDIISRNTLHQISDDLQVLNNMQRSQTDKSVEVNYSFTNLENQLNFKFPTDSYCKILMSDFDVRNSLSGVIYIDDKNELALNIIKLSQEINIPIAQTGRYTIGSVDHLLITCTESHGLVVGDGVVLTFNGGDYSSRHYNQSFFGYQIVQGVIGTQSFYTDKQWQYFNVDIPYFDPGNIHYIKVDPFLNYQPVDIIEVGVDKNPKESVELTPDNLVLTGTSYSLVNVDFNNYRYTLTDGLSVSSLYQNYPWVLEADITKAIIGQDQNGLVWYSGNWSAGRWFGGTWMSGKWLSGDWYDGTWNSFNVKYKLINVEVDKNYPNPNNSKWYNGRWFDGNWNNGIWYDGRRYAGTWSGGTWYNGIWNGGNWSNGSWKGGVWVLGNWNGGTFNCDNKPSYWIDGNWYNGDFENGMWYNGQFIQQNGGLSRFGTKAFNTRTAIWQGGKFKNGEFHSYLNQDRDGNTIASEFNKYSIWNTGIFSGGKWYGGVAYAIDFNSGNWYGGIVEEIQIIGLNIVPGQLTQFILNGAFEFNVNDKIWVVNDNNPTPYAAIGTNLNPGNYTILLSEIVPDPVVGESTIITINLDLSNIMGSINVNDIDTGLRLTAIFKDSVWKSGIFTNGIFDGGYFEGGIWYGGLFALGSNWGY